MVSDSRAVVTETTKVGLSALLLFNFNSHDFDLVVRKANFDLEFVGHDELVSLDGVVVVLLLLLLLLLVIVLLVLLLLLVVLLHLLYRE